ncbi:MAG: PAS domain S-box protein [Ardenticatenaceae bacterium]|nr:PAS domain S-box protein [Ardenticatenaceae bacterium]
MKNLINKPCIRVVCTYFLFGVLWILVTDRLLFVLVPNLPRLVLWQTYKGWFFVIISTLFIYMMLHSTARKRQESQDALAKSEQTYRLLFENNPWPMWVYDLETLAFLAVNEAAVDKYGYSVAEFLDMSIRDIRPVEDLPRLMADVAQTTRSLNFAGEWRHCRKDGTVFPVEITSHTLVYNGRSGRLVIAHDLTERKQAEAAAHEKTEILSRSKSNLQRDMNNQRKPQPLLNHFPQPKTPTS